MQHPSPYRIPQSFGADRRRARMATIRARQADYGLAEWDPPSEEMWAGSGQWLLAPLPRKLAKLPKEQSFSWRKWGQFIANQSATMLNGAATRYLNFGALMNTYRDYASLFETIRPPGGPAERWRSDLDFAEQRLNGCNPMTLQRCLSLPDAPLRATADDTLSTVAPGWTTRTALEKGRLFQCDYSVFSRVGHLVDPAVAKSAPTGLFFAHEDGVLRPLAIRIHPVDHPGPNVPVGPHSGAAAWALAKAHFQMADGAHHEALSHLLDTHLVIELIGTCAYRHLHPDHPVLQLLAPHFTDTLAIDALARTSLLNKGGPIDTAIGVGAKGALALVGVAWSTWDLRTMSLDADLARRGLDDRGLFPFLWYREDARLMWHATHQLTKELVNSWYTDEATLAADWEVQAWAAEVAAKDGAALAGFPARFERREDLCWALGEILFRASAQHAAVNNGQYDRYGWIPYSPCALAADPAHEALVCGAPIQERGFWEAMPTRERCIGQLSMARVLSAPTYTSVIRTGDSPAFFPDANPVAADAVQTYRQRLEVISSSIRGRNQGLVDIGATPYTYLDPYNVSRSIEI